MPGAEIEFGLKVGGVFLGVLAKTVLPHLRKSKEGDPQAFGKKELKRAASTLLVALIITVLIFPEFRAAPPGGLGLEAGFKLFCLAFGFGFGWTGMVEETAEWTRATRRSKAG